MANNDEIFTTPIPQQPLIVEDIYLSKGGNIDLKNYVSGGSGQGAYQYAVAQNGRILSLSDNSFFSFGEGTYAIQVKKYADVYYTEQLSNIATFTAKQMDIITSQYKTSFTLSNGNVYSNQNIGSMLSFIKEIADASLVAEYTEQIVEQVFEKLDITQCMIYSTLPFGSAINTILLKPNLAHVLESMVDSAYMPSWASSGSISFPTKQGDFLKVSIISENTLGIYSAKAGGIIKTLEKGESFIYEDKYLIMAGSIYIERIPDPKNCPIPEVPIDKTNLSQKQRYAGFVRNTAYKQVIVGPASNIVLYDIANTHFSFKFDSIGNPLAYIYSIKDTQNNITKYTVDSNTGEFFTFNGLTPNTTYYLEIFVRYANILQPLGIVNAIIVNTLNEIELKDFSYVAQNNSILISFDQPENKPKKFVVRWKEFSYTNSISGEVEIRNIYTKDFYDRKNVSITNLKIGVSYEIYVDTYFTFSDGSFKEPLSSPRKTILTIYESSLDLSMTNITGNSLDIRFVDNLNTATQPTRYFMKLTKMGLTEEGKLIEISTVYIKDSSSNITRSITGLNKNTRYNVLTTIGYISTNEYHDSTFFYTRDEGPITNFSSDMYNTYGTLFFQPSPFAVSSTVDISFASLNYTLSGDISKFAVRDLDISSTYPINIKTSYVHGNQTNVYEFSGFFNTLNEGPCLEISVLDINAFDVDCSFSDRYMPAYYTITRRAPDGLTRTLILTGVQSKRFQFYQLLHFTEYDITIESIFSNRHTYSSSRTFRTKNEGPLTNLYSYQYSTKLYLFVDFSSNTFTDMSNVVSVGFRGETFDLATYPFKTLIEF